MSLAGLLRQTVTITPVTWTGTTATNGTAVDYPARVERNHHTTESDLGDRIYSDWVAYLPGDATITDADTITYDGTDYRPARITAQTGGDGTTHHLVVDLASLGPDTITITRPATAGDWDPSTGIVNQSPPEVIWSGPATINPSSSPSRSDAAGQDVHTVKVEVSIRHHTPELAVGDIIEVTSTTDPNLTTLRIDSISSGSSQYGQHLICLDDRSNR